MTKSEKKELKAWAVKYLTALSGDREGATIAVNIAQFMGQMSTARKKDFRRWLSSLVQAYDNVILQPERRKA